MRQMAHARSIWSCLALLITTVALPAPSVSAQEMPASATVFAVREADVGDLNSDGDMFDSVWHVYDAQEGTTTNLAMAAGSACSDSFLPPPLLLCVPVTTPVVDKKVSAGTRRREGTGRDRSERRW